MATEGGRTIDRHNWSDGYWESRKTSTGFRGSSKHIRIDPVLFVLVENMFFSRARVSVSLLIKVCAGYLPATET